MNFILLALILSGLSFSAPQDPSRPSGASDSCGVASNTCIYSGSRIPEYEPDCKNSGWEKAKLHHQTKVVNDQGKLETRGMIYTVGARQEMDIWLYNENECYKVENKSMSSAVAVPVGTQEEWANFREKAGEGNEVSISACSDPKWTSSNSDPMLPVVCLQTLIPGPDFNKDPNNFTCSYDKREEESDWYAWQNVQYLLKEANGQVYCLKRIEYWVTPAPRSCLDCTATPPTRHDPNDDSQPCPPGSPCWVPCQDGQPCKNPNENQNGIPPERPDYQPGKQTFPDGFGPVTSESLGNEVK